MASFPDQGRRRLFVWDAETGQRLRAFEHPDAIDPSDVLFSGFSHNGRLFLASRQGAYQIWNIHTPATFSPNQSHWYTEGGTETLFQCTSPPTPEQMAVRFDDETGWAVAGTGRLLFWVPPPLRQGLYTPGVQLAGIMSSESAPTILSTTGLDFSNFRYGSDWKDCFE
ncbi:hypothetical protein BDN72DRAFT_850942 [Pluteus cervinus]|uniref:Uncharacterized protein n=1 Tax=Pluteus cervinus TaxID=181527 RepID=A0ACD3A2L8_9AGAR|nr:hypothetical protein BDN72DRAFT_850942 [Pluteus cervinus]